MFHDRRATRRGNERNRGRDVEEIETVSARAAHCFKGRSDRQNP